MEIISHLETHTTALEVSESRSRPAGNALFTWRQIVLWTAGFMTVVVAVQRSLRYVSGHVVEFDCPYYWPVSIFQFMFPGVREVLVTAAVTAVFFGALKLLERYRFNLGLSLAIGVVLIAGTNLMHGVDIGYYAPIAGDARDSVLKPYSLDGQEYFHDALQVKDPVDFFRRYNEIQPTLHMHGHTHPAGAVLTFYLLEKVLKDPAVIAVFLMLVSCGVTMYFFHKLIQTEVSRETARYLSFLILLLPAVQIYYLATIDALITSLLTAAIYYFCFGKGSRSAVAASSLIAGSLMLTFVSIFILPVIVGFDLLVKKSLRRSAIVIVGVVGLYAGLYFFTGYNEWAAFRSASLYENPNGFMMFVDPANYFFTRIEDVAEILFFFGPFLVILLIRGMRSSSRTPLTVLTFLASLCLLGMYAAGAWRTGETARACAFIYPYLLFPVGLYLDKMELSPAARTQIATLVFLQAVGMQAFGTFYW